VRRPCLTCGVLIPRGSYCGQHDPRRLKAPTPGRESGAAQATSRRAVLERAGGRCEAASYGVRCTATLDLQAHHRTPLRESRSTDPAGGVALCRRHHALVEAARRLS
jgi:hypothetical protein